MAISITLGSYWASSTDYIRCYYILDGGEEVLFGEQVGKADLNVASVASAIVSGERLQIIFKAYENTSGLYEGFPRVMGIDDITVAPITFLYARQSGNWNNGLIWSKEGYNGAACNCIPNENTHVFIKEENIALNVAASAAGLTLEGKGQLNYTNNALLKIVRGGVLEIGQEAKINKSGAITASLNFPIYSYNVKVDGEVSVDNITIDAANVNFLGNGSISVGNNLVVNNAQGNIITNANSFTIANQLNFATSSNNVVFENKGSLTVSSLILNNNGNGINNSGTLNVNTINSNNYTFVLNNTGTINQAGNFTNSTNSAFHNLTGSTWNFSGSGSSMALYAQYPNNTFNYTREGAQSISIPRDGAYNNLTVSGSGAKTTTGDLAIKDNLTVTGSAQLSVNNHALTIGGDWYVNSTNAIPFNNASNTVTFNGTTEQIIESTKANTFSNLTIDKIAHNVKVSVSDLVVTNTLNLVNGGLDLDGNTLSIINSSPTAIARDRGYVKSETAALYGFINWSIANGIGKYVFPFGKSSNDYIPFTFDVTTAGAGAGTVAIATYGTGNDNKPFPHGVENLNTGSDKDNSVNVVDRFWQIDLAGYAVNPVANITFTYANDEADNINDFRAQRWNTEKKQWDAPIAGQTVIPNSVTVSAVSDFSPWTLAGENSLLPIELVYFKGTPQSTGVILKWKTAQETNNDYFTVEKSQDLKTFQEVATIKGKGTSPIANTYNITDPHPFLGQSYYRLKQTDYNGDYKYAKIIPVTYNPSFQQIALYPNPFNGEALTIALSGKFNAGTLPVGVYDSKGQLIRSVVIAIESGNATYSLFFEKRLLQGIYLIKVGNFKGKYVVE